MNLPDDFKPTGALLECFIYFPRFRNDFDALITEGYLKVTGPATCEWIKTKTSLAQYFKWAGHNVKGVTGGFWSPVSRVFGETQRQLSENASRNGNLVKPPESIDFTKLKKILQPYRKQQEIAKTEKKNYDYIKELIRSAEDEDETPETVHEIVQKIGAVFIKNVDKNVQKRR